jgi:hypothetical protein
MSVSSAFLVLQQPYWLHMVVQDHNLILILYGDTSGQSWAALPNYQYNMLFWYNRKELNGGLRFIYLRPKAAIVSRIAYMHRIMERLGLMPLLDPGFEVVGS